MAKRKVRTKVKARAKKRALKRAKTKTRARARTKSKSKSKSRAPAANRGRRKDYGTRIEPFLKKLDDGKRAIVLRVREVVRGAVPGVREQLKWGMPVWSKEGGLLCYCAPAKSWVRFGFFKPVMDDSAGLALEGTSSMAHVKLTSASQIVKEAFTNWTRRAAELNAQG